MRMRRFANTPLRTPADIATIEKAALHDYPQHRPEAPGICVRHTLEGAMARFRQGERHVRTTVTAGGRCAGPSRGLLVRAPGRSAMRSGAASILPGPEALRESQGRSDGVTPAGISGLTTRPEIKIFILNNGGSPLGGPGRGGGRSPIGGAGVGTGRRSTSRP